MNYQHNANSRQSQNAHAKHIAIVRTHPSDTSRDEMDSNFFYPSRNRYLLAYPAGTGNQLV